MSAFERLHRERVMRMAREKIEFDDEPPHGEEQSIIDHLERPIYDGDSEPDCDDWEIDDGS